MSQSAVSRRDLVRAVTRGLLDEPERRSEWLQRLAAYVVTHDMADQTDLIINDIAHELYVQSGLLTVEVVSARELSDGLRARLTELLRSQTGASQVAMHETTDPALLGGFIARTADAEIDASVRSKLNKLAGLAS